MKLIATLCVVLAAACGGTETGGTETGELEQPAAISAPAPAAPQRVITEREAFIMSGLDCSTDPCPAVPNLQCLVVVTKDGPKKQCFYVVGAANAADPIGCLGVRADRTSLGQVTPTLCAPLCGTDMPGSGVCPRDLECVSAPLDPTLYCFH